MPISAQWTDRGYSGSGAGLRQHNMHNDSNSHLLSNASLFGQTLTVGLLETFVEVMRRAMVTIKINVVHGASEIYEMIVVWRLSGRQPYCGLLVV